MLRRSLLSLLCAVLQVWGDDRTDALDAIAPIAAALSNGDTAAMLDAVPRNAENAAELRTNLTALIATSEITSSVEVISAEGGAAELDWYMQIKNRATGMLVDRRRGKLQIRYRGRRLLALGPASFFAPPKP
jgi:hypothetical protein